jgi:hypothetical protein
MCQNCPVPGAYMANSFFAGLLRVLAWMFAIGVAGCLLVIPITAYRLFAVLFEKDLPDDQLARKA